MVLDKSIVQLQKNPMRAMVLALNPSIVQKVLASSTVQMRSTAQVKWNTVHTSNAQERLTIMFLVELVAVKISIIVMPSKEVGFIAQREEEVVLIAVQEEVVEFTEEAHRTEEVEQRVEVHHMVEVDITPVADLTEEVVPIKAVVQEVEAVQRLEAVQEVVQIDLMIFLHQL